MNEQTKELAKQSGFHISSSNLGDIGWVWCSDGYPIDEQLDALVKLVRQDEREACAVVCENFTKQVNEMMYPFNGQTAETKFVNSISNIVAKTFSDAIRARGDK